MQFPHHLAVSKATEAFFQATNHEGGGVFSRRVSAQRPGDQLQMYSGRKTLIFVYLQRKNQCL